MELKPCPFFGIGDLPIRLTHEIINAPTIIPADKDINVLGKEDGE